ncbi:MAG: T9SS type A sorting domain-containing protein [Candidatus Kapaibacterium sp.]
MNLRSYTMPSLLLALLTTGTLHAQVAGPMSHGVSMSRAAAHTPLAKPSSAESQVPNQVYNQGDPTPDEQYMLELINRARANPTAEGVALANAHAPDIDYLYDNYTPKRATVQADFATYPSRPPLAFNAKLIAAARRQSRDMLKNNFQSHVGSDNSTFDQRVNSAGYTGWTYLGENIAAYSSTVWEGHVSLNADFGNADLGHRKNIMNFESDPGKLLTEIGIGIVDTTVGVNSTPMHTGQKVITQDFGTVGGHFLTGVVYKDANKNGFYDVGEGLGGVQVMPASGTYYAVTSASGGYTIPFSGTGSMVITASGGALTAPMRDTVTLGTENIKVNFVPGAPGVPLPAAVMLIGPQNGDNVPTSGVMLNWNRPSTGITKFWLEVGTTPNFATVLISDSTITDTMTVLNNLQKSKIYYWHIRAGNETGWGPASQPGSFITLAAGVETTNNAVAGRISASGPNPFNGSTTIRFTLDRTRSVSLDILNSGGERVTTLVSGTLPADSYAFEWNARDQASGVYFYRLNVGGTTETGKMILSK